MPKESIDLFNLQIDLYKHMKKKALSFEGRPSKELKQYRLNHQKLSRRPFKLTTITDLIEVIQKSQIIYLGDFHTFDQSTKNLERIIQSILSNSKGLTLGFEFIHSKFQKVIDDYMANRISELEFLEGIDYKESWKFPWNHYRDFFKLAKSHKLSIKALNSEGALKSRDEYSAQIIIDELNLNPNNKMLIFYGELHLMINKLPKLVSKKNKININQTIIHQNIDQVYWKLSKGKTSTLIDQIVHFGQNEFCLLTSPPWIKYESMIYWYENLCEDPEYDIHQYIMETGLKTFNGNTQENFIFICKKINDLFNLKIQENDLENFNLHDHLNLEIIKGHIEKIKNKTIKSFYNKILKTGRSFSLPTPGHYFCPNYSFNRISYLAGIHIFSLNSNIHPSNILKLRDNSSKFYYFFHQCFTGHLVNKIINPYKKCDHYLDLVFRLEKVKIKKGEHSNLKMSIKLLDILAKQKSPNEFLKGHQLIVLFSLAKICGHISADLIYKINQNDKHFLPKALDILREGKTERTFNLVGKVLIDGDYKNMKKRYF